VRHSRRDVQVYPTLLIVINELNRTVVDQRIRTHSRNNDSSIVTSKIDDLISDEVDNSMGYLVNRIIKTPCCV
jgi:hypothetical protein